MRQNRRGNLFTPKPNLWMNTEKEWKALDKHTINLQIGGGDPSSELILKPKEIIKLLEIAMEYGEVIIRVPGSEVLNER